MDAVPTQNLEAWEAYQLGKQRLAKRTSEGLIEAEKFFRKSTELDPGFALAYVGLADSLSLRTAYGDTPFLATLKRAQTAVDTALKLDPGLSEAWASSGLIAGERSQIDQAEQMYRKAIELNPNNAFAVKSYGILLVNTWRIDEGIRVLERAANLDPLSALVQKNLASALQSQARFSDAAARYRRAIEIDPSMPGPYWELGYLNAYAWNRFAEAVPLAKKAVDLDPGYPGGPQDLALLYLDMGDESTFFATIEQGARRWPDDWGILFSVALVDQFKGNHTGAVRHAQRSFELFPRWPVNLVLLRDADLRSGRYEDAIARYEKAYPELFLPGAPRLNQSNYGVAVDLAVLLQKRGDTAKASALLDAASDAVSRIPRLGYSGYGITDVRIRALRGQEREALVALREAEKAGWRGPYWRYYRDFDPNLDSIRSEPEFKAIFADIERDMAQQRARLAARPKDAALELTDAR